MLEPHKTNQIPTKIHQGFTLASLVPALTHQLVPSDHALGYHHNNITILIVGNPNTGIHTKIKALGGLQLIQRGVGTLWGFHPLVM